MNRSGESTTFKLYEILEVDPSCSDDQLKRAFRKKALKLHPDKAQGREQVDFIAANEAYKLLSDSYIRKYYNRHGDQGIEMLKGTGPSSINLLNSKNTTTKIVLSVLTHPTILAPISLYIGAQFLLTVLFIWMVDWKNSGWNWSWLAIFSVLWMPLASSAVVALIMTCVALYAFASVALVESADTAVVDEAEERDQRTRLRREMAKAVLSIIKLDVWLGALIWLSVRLQKILDSTDPSQWTSACWPLAWACYFHTTVGFLEFLIDFRWMSSVRERQLRLAKLAIDGFYRVLLFTVLATKVSFWPYMLSFLIAFVSICVSHYVSVLKYDESTRLQLESITRSSTDPISVEQAKEKEMSNSSRKKVFHLLKSICLALQCGFFFSHLLFGWPRSWTWTAFMIVSSFTIQSLVFLILIPLVLLAMDRALPDVSKKTLQDLGAGASSDSIFIDLSAKTIYSFGYALASYQPRLGASNKNIR